MKIQSKFGKKYSLTILTCVTACLAFMMLCVSVSTDNWLSTFERESNDNGTVITAIHSGLWRQCKQSQQLTNVFKKTTWNEKMKTFPTTEISNCTYIIYFKGKPRGLAEIKPPEAILYDMQPAAFFPTTGLLGLLSGCILSFLSYCDQKVKKLIFVGGGLFVLSGIFMLVGIVLYVGSISQAFDSTAGNMDSEEKYVYDYGGSFYLSVVSFILTEFSGIFAIYLYIAKHRHYIRIKREKILARSQSVNSCVGLVPSASRFSFEAPPEHLVNSTDLSSKRKKRDRNISTSTSVEWCDVTNPSNHCSQSQWLLSNSHSKVTMASETFPSHSHEKLFRLPPNGHTKPNVISKGENVSTVYTSACPVTMFYEEEIGETSFGYNPRTDNTRNEGRVFYDNTAATYYMEPHHIFDGRQNFLMSPDHSMMSTMISPQHNKIEIRNTTNKMLPSPLSQLRNIHLLTSLDDEDILSSENIGNHCNCAQLELVNHLSIANDSSILISPPLNVVLPQNPPLSGISSRKITSV